MDGAKLGRVAVARALPAWLGALAMTLLNIFAVCGIRWSWWVSSVWIVLIEGRLVDAIGDFVAGLEERVREMFQMLKEAMTSDQIKSDLGYRTSMSGLEQWQIPSANQVRRGGRYQIWHSVTSAFTFFDTSTTFAHPANTISSSNLDARTSRRLPGWWPALFHFSLHGHTVITPPSLRDRSVHARDRSGATIYRQATKS